MEYFIKLGNDNNNIQGRSSKGCELAPLYDPDDIRKYQISKY